MMESHNNNDNFLGSGIINGNGDLMKGIGQKGEEQLETINTRQLQTSVTALGMNLQELAVQLKGKGKAQLAWDCFKIGMDPLCFYNPSFPQEQLDSALLLHATISQQQQQQQQQLNDSLTQLNRTREEIQEKFLPLKRKSQTMGTDALKQLSSPSCYPSPLGIESSVATLEHITRSNDGTTKLLMKIIESNYLIESVIIPNPEWGKSTLCVSSQVGCKQGCVFCATGKMGRLASLTSDQILIQLYYANKVCRVMEDLPQIDNIVFMGMGEAGDNIDAVTKAVDVMTDRSCFGLAPSKITISTVGPEPQVFEKLAQAGTVLAWSVHAVRDDLRKRLVPTTKHSMEELKDGVVKALVHRSRRLRNLMMEVTLMDGINDGVEEATELADFALDLINRVEGIKLMVNLIPFNDIGYEQYKRSSDVNIAAFQKVLVEKGIKTYVRTTRGDEESAACGQLATKRTKKLEEYHGTN